VIHMAGIPRGDRSSLTAIGRDVADRLPLRSCSGVCEMFGRAYGKTDLFFLSRLGRSGLFNV